MQDLSMLYAMSYSKLPRSLRIFLRREKARLRREISDTAESSKTIRELIEKIMRARAIQKK